MGELSWTDEVKIEVFKFVQPLEAVGMESGS